jgi:hypothetical protein
MDIVHYLNIFFYFLESLVFIVGIVGNSFVLYIIFSDKRLQSNSSYVLIANISISDVLSSIAIPAKILRVSDVN